MIPFSHSKPLTLGVEMELQLIDPETLDLKSCALEILNATAGNDKVKPEIFQSMLEINTGICEDAHAAEADLAETLSMLRGQAHRAGVRLATTGTHPFARYSQREPYPSDRNMYLIDRNQWIARRIMIFGLHVHIGMKGGDSCIRFNNFFLYLIPHLIAITASSPFWQGDDTGLASSRSTIFEACPTAGHPNRVESWEGFSTLCSKLIHSKAIKSHKDLWWDIRPSPEFGTLEIRCCDGLATLSETMAVVAFIHALAHWYEEHGDYDPQSHAPYMWMMRENKWRALRHGLEADIIMDGDADIVPIRQEIEEWLTQLAPYAERLGYEKYFADLKTMLARGASYTRQLRVFEKTGSIAAVVRHNVEECELGRPIYLD